MKIIQRFSQMWGNNMNKIINRLQKNYNTVQDMDCIMNQLVNVY